MRIPHYCIYSTTVSSHVPCVKIGLMNQLLPILFLFIGLAIGVTAAWLVLRAKGQNAYDRGKADAEGERIALTERIQARDQTIAGLNAKIQQLEQKVQESRPPNRISEPNWPNTPRCSTRNGSRPRKSWMS